MAPISVAEQTPVLPSDVVEFAKQQGIEEFLPPIWEMTKRIFPSACRSDILLEDDPEIPELKFIVFYVEVTGFDVSHAVEAQQQWCRESLQYPTDSPNCGGVLRLNLVS